MRSALAGIAARNNINIKGSGSRTIVFAHGFGCDQNMWRLVSPAFEGEFRTILYDHVGAGGSDLSAYVPEKYATLSGYSTTWWRSARPSVLRTRSSSVTP